MAKIVPRGYADIGAYDERDDFFNVLDYLTKIGNTYQEVKKERVKEGVSSITYLNSLLDEASSPDDVARVNSLYKSTGF